MRPWCAAVLLVASVAGCIAGDVPQERSVFVALVDPETPADLVLQLTVLSPSLEGEYGPVSATESWDEFAPVDGSTAYAGAVETVFGAYVLAMRPVGAFALTAAVADGPLPVGDALGVVALAVGSMVVLVLIDQTLDRQAALEALAVDAGPTDRDRAISRALAQVLASPRVDITSPCRGMQPMVKTVPSGGAVSIAFCDDPGTGLVFSDTVYVEVLGAANGGTVTVQTTSVTTRPVYVMATTATPVGGVPSGYWDSALAPHQFVLPIVPGLQSLVRGMNGGIPPAAVHVPVVGLP